MKKILTGNVVSARMDKTRVVEVTRNVRHPLYKKRYRVSRRFFAQDQENRAKLGDLVTIKEMRPLSKLKRWRIASIMPSAAPLKQVNETKESHEAPLPKRGAVKKKEAA